MGFFSLYLILNAPHVEQCLAQVGTQYIFVELLNDFIVCMETLTLDLHELVLGILYYFSDP